MVHHVKLNEKLQFMKQIVGLHRRLQSRGALVLYEMCTKHRTCVSMFLFQHPLGVEQRKQPDHSHVTTGTWSATVGSTTQSLKVCVHL